MSQTPTPPFEQPPQPGAPLFTTDRRILALKRRLLREGTMAVSMLEAAMAALWPLDLDAAMNVRLSDDRIDSEEVAIEQETYEILALHHPFARDFRVLTFILRANADFERVADHASSVAKAVKKITEARQREGAPAAIKWPTSLTELGQRVPALCHSLIQAVMDEDVEAARQIVTADKVIDTLDRRLFEEVMEMMKVGGKSDADLATGMYVYRVGRELERVGDLMANVAEDVVYLATGEIIRHEKRRAPAKK
ncbi:MAG TPA: phosphate signaling complex protein PhoU [Phycisphaerales bacterium]|nr:phosphate signaling complex protein PhoU [Phycisphaerales bacterium]